MFPSRFPVVLFLCLFLLRLGPALSDDFDDLLNNKRKAVLQVAAALAKQMPQEEWCDSSRDCTSADCVPHGCSGGSFGKDFKCSTAIKLTNPPQECENSPDGVLLNLNRTFIWTPPGALSTKGDGSDIVIENMDIRRDVCSLKKIENDIISAHTKNKMKEWLYATTTNGAFTIFPGVALSRTDNSITACGFNPVIRPWYIAAASGTKDIVFLLDTTSLLTNSKKLLPALNQTLEGLDKRDYFAVVAFGSNNSIEVLGDTGGLQQASREVKNVIQGVLFDFAPSGGFPNVSAAFSLAFDILEAAADTDNSSKCSKLIVLLSGKDDACFDECSLDCKCVEKVRKLIDKRQSQLDGDKASIVSFTEGDSRSAERLARTIVCNKDNRGIWRRVSDEDTPDTAMSTYSQIVAASLFAKEPIAFFSEPFDDVAGLGRIFTIAIPVYSNDEQRLVGVAAADITVEEVIAVVGNEDEAFSRILAESDKSRSCSNKAERSSCELQRLRSQPNSAVCADILPSKKCYKFGSSVYKPVTKLTDVASWVDAETSCKSMNGSLVKIDTSAKNKFLSGIASADGSWIGLRAKQTQPLLWQDGSSLEYDDFDGDVQAESSALQDAKNTETCATIDRRGIEGNWNVERCDAQRLFICEISENAISECEDDIFDEATTPYDPVNDVDDKCTSLSGALGSCNEEQSEEIESANPLCKERDSDFSTVDRSCCGGRADRAVEANETELSGGDNQSGGDGDQGLALVAIIGIAVAAGLVGVLLLVGMVYGFLKYRSRRDPDAEGNEPSEVIGQVTESGTNSRAEPDTEVGSLQPEDFESAFSGPAAGKEASRGENASANFDMGVRPESGGLDDYGY